MPVPRPERHINNFSQLFPPKPQWTTDTGRGSILFLNLDFADLASVRHAAAEFMSNLKVRGIMCPLEFLTMKGHDGQFGVNVLGHVFLSQCLLPVLTSTAKSEGLIHKVRVVHTSSNGHELLSMPGGTDWTALRLGNEGAAARRKPGLRKLYGMSKLGECLVLGISKRHMDVLFESFRFDIRIHTLRDGLDLPAFQAPRRLRKFGRH